MNLPQRIILLLAFVIVLMMALFPPWIYVYDAPQYTRQMRAERPAGYHLLFGDHTPQDQSQLVKLFNLNVTPINEYDDTNTWAAASLRFFSVRMDMTRLTIQIGAALILTSILYLALRRKLSD